ncbi:class I SAM-dependent methyltransferase [Amycolatopsis sp. CA-230715]|uniref:class I SAM-dependent methyltransferase n=1 Tax=Amycolatopsis sp. CA-230715 TaxID=2745196 RepID=UPI001C027CC3|nr:methyltransferase domain-containing protein [Amycolatopsis sp. CA-230715]QWF77706.1 hypothetical protein HUW46_01098 [Amycolatopsis sp. CA-230715]
MPIINEFLRHPMRTGAVAASSPRLAETMTTGIGLERARTVVELGPGTGVFTGAVLSRLARGARLVAVEINPRLAAELRARYAHLPVTVVEGSAEALAEHVDGPVDAVVSGLPWTAMPERLQRRILGQATRILHPEGRFTTFAYAHTAWTPPARRFLASLRASFAVLERSALVWPNLPPAFAYRAALPVAGAVIGARGERPAALGQ